MKRLVSLVLVGLAVGAGISGYFYVQSRGSVPKYRTARVERGPLTAAVSATGNLNAVITVQVGSQVSGQIAELRADFNTLVKKNQIIARIDPEIFEAKVNQARADVASAQAAVMNQEAQVERARADVENARAALAEAKANSAKAQVTVVDSRRDFDRKTELHRRDLIATSDRDTAQATHDSSIAMLDAARAKERSLDAAIGSAQAQLRVNEAMLTSARAQVKQKQASLVQAQIDLEHTTIRAPVDGVVISRAVDVGQTVAASLQAPTLFTIAQDVVTYTVVVTVHNPDGKLVPGMTANVKLIVAEKPNALKVSNAALRFRPAGADGGPAGPAAGPGSGSGRGGGAAVGSTNVAPGGGSGAGEGRGGRQSLEEIRDRLVKQLGLTQEQQARLEPILQESRQQMMALRDLPEQERRAKGQKIREASRGKIRALLTPPQQAKYDEMSPGGPSAGGGDRTGTPGRVYIVDADGKPKAVSVGLGISDGSATELLQGDLKEGQDVVAGLAGAAGGGRPGTP